jgi:hypothetical protein
MSARCNLSAWDGTATYTTKKQAAAATCGASALSDPEPSDHNGGKEQFEMRGQSIKLPWPVVRVEIAMGEIAIQDPASTEEDDPSSYGPIAAFIEIA